jgi:probable HAF family extracellular repeat protein
MVSPFSSKARRIACVVSLSSVGLLSLGVVPATAASQGHPEPRYIAIDVGTLGGPDVYPNEPGRTVSNNGIVVGSATTPALNPFPQEPGNVFDAFEWKKGVMTDLGTLGGYNAGIFELNAAGIGAGFSETGVLDPLTAFPQAHAAASNGRGLIDLGTLGGNESWAVGINDRGEISGFASNTTPDPNAHFITDLGLAPYPSATQWRAAVWSGGHVKDLGTLGGPDSIGGLLNERGQVAGVSFTNATPNATTGLPTLDPFQWDNGRMRDLGSLGGTLGFVSWMNNRGEVVGFSDLAGDQNGHPYLWNGKRLVDLGTLGGDGGTANWVNQAGEVVGSADLPGVSGSQVHHGFLWKGGHMTDLALVGSARCGNAFGINAKDQVVGNETDCQSTEVGAMLWQNGSAFDLNSLIGASSLDLKTADYINDRGEIYCEAQLPNGDHRMVLLVPSDEAASEGLIAPAPSGHTRAAEIGGGARVQNPPWALKRRWA